MAEGFLDFTPGQVLTAAQVDDYLMRQAVMRFADSAARTTALSTVLVEGMMSYLKDTNAVEVYDGSAWVTVGAAGPANFTDTATGTYTSGGTDYKYLTFTASGTLTVDVAGYADVFVLGGGGGGTTAAGGGSGGGAIETQIFLTATTHTVTVGAGGSTGANGNASSIGSIIVVSGGLLGTLTGCNAGGMATSTEYPYNDSRSARYRTTSGAGGAGAVGDSTSGTGGAGYTTNIENSSRTNLGEGGDVGGPVAKSANTGQGGDATGGASTAGGSGLIVVRVEV
jgi:hypothetical protein